jgi:hypothetical protein
MAFVGASALATGSTTVTPVYASAVKGNLLTAFVTSHSTSGSTLSGSTAGWVQREAVVASTDIAEIWDKIATGNDTMPTWNFTGSVSAVIVAEFSQNTVFDRGGTQTGTTSPITVTASGTDGGSGRLIVAVRGIRTSASTTNTWTDNVNSLGVGTGINVLGDNGATSQASHHRSLYVTIASTGNSADNDVATWSSSTAHAALAIASYAVPTVPTQVPRAPRFARSLVGPRQRRPVGFVPDLQAVQGNPRAMDGSRVMALYVRRKSRSVATPQSQAAPVNPAFVEWWRRERIMRPLRYWLRRGRYKEPPWGQAAVPPYQFVPLMVQRTTKRLREYVRRARRFEPPWPQFNPPFAVWPGRTRRAVNWLRRRSSLVLFGQIGEMPQQGARRRLAQWLRRRAPSSPIASSLADTTPLRSRRARLFTWMRRRPRQDPPFQTVLQNPPIVEWWRRRLTWPRSWQRRGKALEPPWGQAAAVQPPSYVDAWRRRARLAASLIRRGRSTSPLLDQAVPPLGVRRPQVRVLMTRRSRTRSVPVLSADLVDAARRVRHALVGALRRIRSSSLVILFLGPPQEFAFGMITSRSGIAAVNSRSGIAVETSRSEVGAIASRSGMGAVTGRSGIGAVGSR